MQKYGNEDEAADATDGAMDEAADVTDGAMDEAADASGILQYSLVTRLAWA